MSTEEAIQVLLQVEEIKERDAENMEKIKKQKEQATKFLKRHLETTKLPYLKRGAKYMYLKQKEVKASLSEDLIRIVYRRFQTQLRNNSPPTDEEVNAFMGKIEKARAKLSGTEIVLETSKTMPLASLLD